MSYEPMQKIHELLGDRHIIYYGDQEVIRDLMITEIHTAQQIPPYDHFVISFEARCQSADFDFATQYPHAPYNTKYTVKHGDMDIPIFIDSYTIEVPYIDMFSSGFSQTPPPPPGISGGATAVINGHFDSRCFDDGVKIMTEEEMMASEEPIYNRFEILDL